MDCEVHTKAANVVLIILGPGELRRERLQDHPRRQGRLGDTLVKNEPEQSMVARSLRKDARATLISTACSQCGHRVQNDTNRYYSIDCYLYTVYFLLCVDY
jgi:hypothetical protein